MQSEFTTLKDLLDVVVVPITLAVLALAWPAIQLRQRGRRFRLLAARELVETAPFPEPAGNDAGWTHHLQKKFLHRKIIQEISDNRDFVLGLDPDFIYSLSQLWEAFEAADGSQWLWYLGKLGRHPYLRSKRKELLEVRQKWLLLEGYSSKLAPPSSAA